MENKRDTDPTKKRITVSKISKGIEEESENKSESGKAIMSARNIERKFVALIRKMRANEEDFKDENGNYSFDEKMKAGITAILLESIRKNSMLDKILKDKEDDIEDSDILDFFFNLVKNTEGKMDEETRVNFLNAQNKNTNFSLVAILYNISTILSSIMMNIQVYPYEIQVQIMHELFENVFEKFNEVISNEIKDFIINKLEIKKLEKEIESEGMDNNCDELDEDLKKVYDDMDNATKEVLKRNKKLRTEVENSINCNIEELI